MPGSGPWSAGGDEHWWNEIEQSWSKTGLAALLANTTEAVVVIDATGQVRFATPQAQQLLGHQSGSLLGSGALDLVHPDDLDAAVTALDNALAARPVEPITIRLRGDDGTWRSVTVSVRDLLEHPDVAGLVVTLRDVTAQVEAETSQAATERHFQSIAEAAPDMIFRYRLGPEPGFTFVNPAAERLTGYPPDRFYDDAELLDLLLDADTIARIARMGRDLEAAPHRISVTRADGSTVWAEMRCTLRIVDGEVVEVDGVIRDLTHRVETEQELLHRAMHDSLTGLPNRALFHERLDRALRRANRLPSSPAVVFCDLDGFKAVNDTHGHRSGDQVLREIARRLEAVTRSGDTVARLGGDEFLVLCDDLDTDHALDKILARLKGCVADPVDLDGTGVSVDISIGVARAKPDSTADELIAEADQDMYRDKHRRCG